MPDKPRRSRKLREKISGKLKESLLNGGYTTDEIESIANFGKRLQGLRINRQMTQQELAEQLNVVSSTIGKYERKLDSFPSVDVFLRLSKYFNVSVDYLLKGIETLPDVARNGVSDMLINSSFVHADHGDIVVHGMEISTEAQELLKIYNKLSGWNKLKLLRFALDMEEETHEIKTDDQKTK